MLIDNDSTRARGMLRIKRARAAAAIAALLCGAACASAPPQIVRSTYVGVPDRFTRSAAFDISNGLDADEGERLIKWMASFGEAPGAGTQGKRDTAREYWKDVVAALAGPVTFTDLNINGRVARLFDGTPQGFPYEGQDARFEYKLLPHEILVFVTKREEHFASKFAFAFYRHAEVDASRPAGEMARRGSVGPETPYVGLLIFDRILIDTVK